MTEYGIRNTILSIDHRPSTAHDLPPVVERISLLFTRAVAAVFHARRKIATTGVLAVAALVAYHAVFGANGMIVYEKKRTELKSVNVDVEKLQQENQQLSDQIKALKSDPKAIEKEAREQLRYARPGEVVYLLPGQKRADTPPPNATAEKR
jgi:cell division protein FtsB